MRIPILVLALVALILTSCSQRNIDSPAQRTMDTPADRLVGHWSTKSGDSLYYSKVKTDGIGSYILVQTDGNTALHKYKVVSQIPAGERVIVQLLFSDGDKRDEQYIVGEDGKELVKTTEILGGTVTGKLKYVDGKIEP